MGRYRRMTRRGYSHPHPGYKNREGYMIGMTCLLGEKKFILVHRMVAMAFLPKPDGCDIVHHRNRIRHDNRVVNLEWSTKSQNLRYAHAAGGYRWKRLLSDSDVLDVIAALKQGMPQEEIAENLGVAIHVINDLARGRTYTELTAPNGLFYEGQVPEKTCYPSPVAAIRGRGFVQINGRNYSKAWLRKNGSPPKPPFAAASPNAREAGSFLSNFTPNRNLS